MNKEYVAGNLFPRAFADVALGLARRAESVYLKGDGFGHSDSEINAQVMSLVVEWNPYQLMVYNPSLIYTAHSPRVLSTVSRIKCHCGMNFVRRELDLTYTYFVSSVIMNGTHNLLYLGATGLHRVAQCMWI